MIKFKFLFLTIAFFCDNINDNYTWNENGSDFFYRKFGTNGYDYGWSGSFSPYDDSIIIAGSRQTAIGGDRDLWAIKTDSRGKTIWDKPFLEGRVMMRGMMSYPQVTVGLFLVILMVL